MKILVSSLQAPYPPYDGGGVRTVELLKGLSERHHVTFLGTFDPETESPVELKAHLLNVCNRVELVPYRWIQQPWGRLQQLHELFVFPPTRITRFLNSEYIKTAARLAAEPFDLIIGNTILAGQWLDKFSTQAPKILDTVDVFALMRQRERELQRQFGLTALFNYIDWKKTAIYERHLWRCFDQIIAISEQDARVLNQACPKKKTTTIPTGINIPQLRNGIAGVKKFDLLMVGKWDYPPNVDALKYFDTQIMPWVVCQYPSIQVAIVGKGQPEKIEAIVTYRNNYRIFCNVPNIVPYYCQSRAAIIPMRAGSGIKVKLLEALANQTPVVTTTIGAYGVPVENGVHVMIADDPKEFSNAISKLVSDSEVASALARRGKEFVRERYDWCGIKRQYLEFVESCVADFATRRTKLAARV